MLKDKLRVKEETTRTIFKYFGNENYVPKIMLHFKYLLVVKVYVYAYVYWCM